MDDLPVIYANDSVRVSRAGNRNDVEVDGVAPFEFLTRLRDLFYAVEEEIESHKADPISLANALANLETILAGVRNVRDRVKTLAASALAVDRIRRLTVTGVVTVESVSEIRRTAWDNEPLLTAMLDASNLRILDTDTGTVFQAGESARLLLAWFRPEWRLTPIRNMGINPDAFCSVLTDDDGYPMKTPSLKIVDNSTRSIWK